MTRLVHMPYDRVKALVIKALINMIRQSRGSCITFTTRTIINEIRRNGIEIDNIAPVDLSLISYILLNEIEGIRVLKMYKGRRKYVGRRNRVRETIGISRKYILDATSPLWRIVKGS